MAGSLRDQLAEVYDQVVPDQVIGGGEATPAPIGGEAEAAPPAAPEKAVKEEKQASLPLGDDRPRDPATGQFVKKDEAAPAKAEAVPSAAVVHKAPSKPQQAAAPSASPAVAATPPPAAVATPPAPKARPQRPSSWKKEMWEHWDKLDPNVAEYIHTRESQYANGVSTYKAELDAHKPVIDAMQQFMPELQQYKIDPKVWITELGNIHRTLAFGTPQQKLQVLANVFQAYKIPPQAFSSQEAMQQYVNSGQWQQPYQPPVPPQQQPLTQEAAEKLWQQKYLEATSNQEIERFAADTVKHPHFEALRDTMGQLLDAGMADDLESAYETALRMPKHSDIWNAMQEQQRATEEAERQRQQQERVRQARGKAVSPASATPNAPGSEEKPKGLRSQLSESFDAHMGGRV